MPTDVEIGNAAAARAGSSKIINDLDDTTPTAQHIKRFFNIARLTILRAHQWNFATKKLPLTLSSEPSHEWLYVYSLPADCVRANEIVKANKSDPKIDFELGVSEDLNSKLLYTNKALAILSFNADITNTTLFDDTASDLMITKLAAEISYPLTKSKSLRGQLLTMYENQLQSAKLIDAAEGRIETPQVPSWIEARTLSRNEDR